MMDVCRIAATLAGSLFVLGAPLLHAPCVLFTPYAEAQSDPELPPSTGDGIIDEETPTSPKAPWGEFTVTEDHGGSPWWASVLLWVPNRVLDFIDVFRVDVGVGPAAGAVVRITEVGQLGYRQMLPFSVRVGAFGRHFPAIIETSNEIGAGPAFIESKDRSICSGEVGLGADLAVVGAYGGVCFDELADFIAGVFFIDFKDDDLD